MPMGNKAYPVKKGVTNVHPTHVKNGDGGMYGGIEESGFRARKGELNQFDKNSWEDPTPTTGTR